MARTETAERPIHFDPLRPFTIVGTTENARALVKTALEIVCRETGTPEGFESPDRDDLIEAAGHLSHALRLLEGAFS